MSLQAAPRPADRPREHSARERAQATARLAAEAALLELTMIGFSLSGWELVAAPAELPLRRQLSGLIGKVTTAGSAAAGRLMLAALDSTTLLMTAVSWIAGSAVRLLRHLVRTDGGPRQAPACPQPAIACPPLRTRCVS